MRTVANGPQRTVANGPCVSQRLGLHHPAHVGHGAPPAFLSGISATIASVVRMFLAIDAAFWSAERVTIAGSMMPALTRSTISPVMAINPSAVLALRTSLTMTAPSSPALCAIWRSGSSSALQHDLRAGLLVLVLEPVEADGVRRVQQRDAAAGDDALLERRARRLERVLDAMLLLLHLGLSRRADLDDCHTARQLREALLELLLVEVGVGVLDLGLDLVDAALDRLGVTPAVDDRGGVLGDHDSARVAELGELGVLELEAQLLGDHLAAGEDRDDLEQPLAAIAEARGLDRETGERAAQLVDRSDPFSRVVEALNGCGPISGLGPTGNAVSKACYAPRL